MLIKIGNLFKIELALLKKNLGQFNLLLISDTVSVIFFYNFHSYLIDLFGFTDALCKYDCLPWVGCGVQ